MQLFLFKQDRKLYSSAFEMARFLVLLFIIAGAVQDDGNSTMQVDRPHDVPAEQSVSGDDGGSSSDDLTELRRVEWERAEEKYGLYRPDPGETVVVVHRIDRLPRDLLLPLSHGMIFLWTTTCFRRKSSMILPIGTMTSMLSVNRSLGGYVGFMTPRDLPDNLFWRSPTMCLFMRMIF